MGITVQPYTEDRIPAVEAFNQRLARGGYAPEFRFPESNIPHWLPKKDGRRIFQEYYLAVENEFVRGGFILKYQDFALQGQSHPVIYYHLPLSEGVIDKAYASTGVLMLRSAMKMQPELFALGMGGFNNPLPVMLKAMGWTLSAVPFYFRVTHPFRFLREIRPLRSSFLRVAISEIAAFTGLGWGAIKALQGMRSNRFIREIEVEPVTTFGEWADQLWKSCYPLYSMIASRESDVLNCLYPPGTNFLSFKILKASQVVGWAVVLDTPMQGNKYFGDLRVGSLVDCLAAPENASEVVQAAVTQLEKRGVDLIVCNHSHAAWRRAFQASGFFSSPSNFIFAASKPLIQHLALVPLWPDQVYLMRGDGDGPVNL